MNLLLDVCRSRSSNYARHRSGWCCDTLLAWLAFLEEELDVGEGGLWRGLRLEVLVGVVERNGGALDGQLQVD